MEKKFKFSDKSTVTKLVYASVIAILCITAIVVGIVAASSRAKDNVDNNPPIENPGTNTPGNEEPPLEEPPKEENKPLCFVSPTVGTVEKEHSLTMPVFSHTLGEWRVHAGLDIGTEAGASVYAAEAGTVSAIYNDPLLGFTVEISHRGDFKTRYSNLDSTKSTLKVGDAVCSGDLIGNVGESSISELADEPHLHFEMLLSGSKVNPLDYISEDSKKASLGIIAED